MASSDNSSELGSIEHAL